MVDRDTEHWLRLHGLPYFVRPDARARHLLPRTAPFLVFAVSIDVLGSLALEVDIDPDTASVGEWGWAPPDPRHPEPFAVVNRDRSAVSSALT